MEKVHIEQIRPDLTWRIRHTTMYPDQPYDIVKLKNDPDGLHFGLFAGDQLVSVVSLFNEGTIYQFRKFATIPEFQGKGYGSLLLQHLINYVNALGATMFWCNARSTAIPFYAKFGFSETDQRFTQTDLEFVIMQLQLNN
ncbi:GNAT family N-acetyltransferase [Pedobacter gandavensis]|uniref:GNAT family N-acetyltransferase n=1 Tax=Pedobacter gandavensis TaxID=2679963 RepID=UPI00292F9DE2|nr:GNAT family N-acetyltransferase [Pedobacter gandavensis]